MVRVYASVQFCHIDGDGQLDVFGYMTMLLSRMWKADGEALIFDASLIDLTDYDYGDYLTPTLRGSGNYGSVFGDFDLDGGHRSDHCEMPFSS